MPYGWENPNVWFEQIAFGGIYLPVLLAFLVAAGVVYMMLRLVLMRVRAYRMFWHPALAGAAVFTIVLAVLLLVFGP